MKHAKHTQGPWSVLYSSNVYPSIHAGPTSTPIASLYAHTPMRGERDVFDNAEANARLIAAAPELLEGAQKTLAWLHEFVGADAMAEILGETHGNRPVEAIKKLLSACAKATGGAE